MQIFVFKNQSAITCRSNIYRISQSVVVASVGKCNHCVLHLVAAWCTVQALYAHLYILGALYQNLSNCLQKLISILLMHGSGISYVLAFHWLMFGAVLICHIWFVIKQEVLQAGYLHILLLVYSNRSRNSEKVFTPWWSPGGAGLFLLLWRLAL